jgi:hypothetical protein
MIRQLDDFIAIAAAISENHLLTGERVLRPPMESWKTYAADLETWFNLTVDRDERRARKKAEVNCPPRPSNALYRFVVSIIPLLTGEHPSFQAVRSHIARRRSVKLPNRRARQQEEIRKPREVAGAWAKITNPIHWRLEYTGVGPICYTTADIVGWRIESAGADDIVDLTDLLPTWGEPGHRVVWHAESVRFTFPDNSSTVLPPGIYRVPAACVTRYRLPPGIEVIA